MGEIKITKSQLEKAVKDLEKLSNTLEGFPGYDINSTITTSKGESVSSITNMFKTLNQLKSVLINSCNKTGNALKVIEEDFDNNDKKFAQIFNSSSKGE
ncbi:MAG: hypothetical protein PHH04_03690 [Thomasclavelia sp.]|nr:hypothetical protein [Thomasclavelia sp.]